MCYLYTVISLGNGHWSSELSFIPIIYKYTSISVEGQISLQSILVQKRNFPKRFFITYVIVLFRLVFFHLYPLYTNISVERQISLWSILWHLIKKRIFIFFYYICDRLIPISIFSIYTHYIQIHEYISRETNKPMEYLLALNQKSIAFNFCYYICDSIIPISIFSFIPIIYKYTIISVEGQISLQSILLHFFFIKYVIVLFRFVFFICADYKQIHKCISRWTNKSINHETILISSNMEKLRIVMKQEIQVSLFRHMVISSRYLNVASFSPW